MALKQDVDVMMQTGNGRGFFLKGVLALTSAFLVHIVVDFSVVECAGHVPFAFVRFSQDQLRGLGQEPVAELYTSGNRKVTHNPLKSWDSTVSPGYGGYTQGKQFYGFAIDRDQLSSGTVKTQLKDGDCSGLRLEVHPRGNMYPRLVADLDFASVSWKDDGNNENYYLHIDMRGQLVEYVVGDGRRGEVVRGRESAETSINVDPSFSDGRGYGVHSQGSGGTRSSSSSSGSSSRSGLALSGGRQWARAGSPWGGYRR